MSNRIFLDIHAIQTLPPSNINRDDAGSPKTAQYGGVQRARVSSQSWKRAIREYFDDNSDMTIGKRTKKVIQYVRDIICEKKAELSLEQAFDMAKDVVNGAGLKTDKDDLAKALFFIGRKQAEALADAAISDIVDKDKLKGAMKNNPSIDIALFGRMLADDASLNEDASAQVAHAISTHEVRTEYDYFTALDDLSKDDATGAGMLGTVEYNSSTLYRYANVAVHELLHQLGDKDAVVNSLKLFTEAFVKSLPTGKVNTFANQTLPQAVMINIRGDRPVNLVSAFEEPIKSAQGFVKESEERMFREVEKTNKFVNKPLYTLYISDIDIQNFEGASKDTFEELLNEMSENLYSLVGELKD